MNLTDELLTVVRTDDTLKFIICGDIDHHTAKIIKKQIDSEIFVHRPNAVLLDLERVDFMDSSGLGLILGRYQLATKLGVAFALYEPTPSVVKLLKLSGCDKIINIIQKRSK